MAKTDGRNIYDPQITPERVIIAEKLKLLESMIGTNRAVRSGEQYMTSCQCGSYIVTSSAPETSQFIERHLRCRYPAQTVAGEIIN